jgi:hypothetical protein
VKTVIGKPLLCSMQYYYVFVNIYAFYNHKFDGRSTLPIAIDNRW